MKASKLIWVFVMLSLGFVDAARRRVRSTTATTVTTTPASYVGRHSVFTGQNEELENPWDKFDIQKLDSRLETWNSPNDTSEHHDEIILGRQYPGLPGNPGDTNELPSPISPPVQPILPPQNPLAPGCLGQRGQYPSLKSCANYLNCWDDVVVEQTCPTGLLFNDITGYCDFDYNVNCGNRPPATPKPQLPPGSKLCPDPNGRYRSSTNCSEFYVCITSRPIKFNCPRGLVYNDILNVCDYPYNVDCKGAATPKPPVQSSSTYPTYAPQSPTYAPQSPTYAPQPPTYTPQSPTYAPQPPTYAPQSPTYAPQPPTYVPQSPTYAPQPPTYQPAPPKPPSYPVQPQPYPPPSSYPNPWLNRTETDLWHQRQPAIQLEINKERHRQDLQTDNEQSSNQSTDISETSSLSNPWTVFQVVPPELMSAPCQNGEVHRLNDTCTNVMVCRNNRPQLIRCSPGFSYDRPSDSCRPFNIAKC